MGKQEGGEGGLKERLAPEGTQGGGAAHPKPDQSSMGQCTPLSPMLSLEGPLREVFPQSPCSVSSGRWGTAGLTAAMVAKASTCHEPHWSVPL